MIISSVLFDLIFFGGLIFAVIVDALLPQLAGAATLIALAAAVYVGAGELSHRLHKQDMWTQEALSSGLALSVLFFVYWWWRNTSDLSLLALSVVLMMTALMLTIAVIGCVNAMWTQKSAAPLTGFAVTAIGSLLLGALAAPLALAFNVAFKVGAIVIGGVIWKMRERVSPPEEVDDEAEIAAVLKERWMLLPRGGRSLDRLLPVLLLGILLMFAARQMGQSAPLPGTPSIAAPANQSGE